MIITEELLKDFKTDVSDRALDIDPNNEQDWHSIALGWALAKGYGPNDSLEIATYIRYHTELA